MTNEKFKLLITRSIEAYGKQYKELTFDTYIDAATAYKQHAADTAFSQATIGQGYSVIQLFEMETKLHEIEFHSYNSAWKIGK